MSNLNPSCHKESCFLSFSPETAGHHLWPKTHHLLGQLDPLHLASALSARSSSHLPGAVLPIRGVLLSFSVLRGLNDAQCFLVKA